MSQIKNIRFASAFCGVILLLLVGNSSIQAQRHFMREAD